MDLSKLDLRGALDFAIGNEEDSQLRYEEFSRLVEDPAAAEFFRQMVANEDRHRQRLQARRDVLFRHSPRHVDSCIVGDGWAPDEAEVARAMSAREAIEAALRAELRSQEFYAAAIPLVSDPDVRALLEELEQEEAEHAGALREMLRARTRSGRFSPDRTERFPQESRDRGLVTPMACPGQSSGRK